jgi:hypothetical protein
MALDVRLGLPVVLMLGVTVLAGCGGGQSSTAAPPSKPAGSAPATSTAAGGVAAPGAKFTFGQTAELAFQSSTASGANGPTYKVAVTVQAPQQGTLADFKGVQLDASEKAGTPDYVQVKITNLGPGTLDTSSSDPSVELQGVDNTGSLQDSVTFIGDFPRCNDATPPAHWAVGQTFSTCLTFIVPGGINKVGYIGTENYINSPVEWAAS